MTNVEKSIWHWYHNVSECFYHIQLTIKYRREVLIEKVEAAILESLHEAKEKYTIDISNVGFDQNHVHIMVQFLPKYSGGDVIRLLKNITARNVFLHVPEVKKDLWKGEFWTDGYYIGTISARGNRKVIENYIRKQGRNKDIEQLRMFGL